VKASLSSSALQDLANLLAYYREQEVPEVGDRLVSEIFARIQQLEHFPDLGRIVPEFEMAQLRELSHPPFGSYTSAKQGEFESFECKEVRDESSCRKRPIQRRAKTQYRHSSLACLRKSK
jgi:hypothetical protein